MTGDDQDNLALCDQCRFAFCKKCKKTYHSQTLCADELALMELKDKRRKLRQKIEVLNLTAVDEEKFLQDFVDIARIENTTRRCPNLKCQVPIEKNMGCNHMYCIRCKTSFDWNEALGQTTQTSVLIEKYENDIDQIRDALKREQFGDETVENLSLLQQPSISQLLVQRTKQCPNLECKKLNIKSGTGNYLICQSCKRGFCFSCGQSVRNPNQHYGNACKRHSAL